METTEPALDQVADINKEEQKQKMENTEPTLDQVEEKDSSFNCEICSESVKSIKRFKIKECTHDSYCNECITKYVEAKVDENSILSEIKCPGLDCKESLDPLSCRSILSDQVFKKWCDGLLERVVLGMGYEKFICPYSDCSSVLFSDCTTVTKASCLECKSMICVQCKVPWHAGYLCEELDSIKDKNDELLGKLAEDMKWKRCPNCKFYVEKISGCNDISCRLDLPSLKFLLLIHEYVLDCNI
ncbi:RBR-type E3 ubiquitin transferase [Ranunculus cassubicifolius]